ncbi:protein of unknown function DUF2229 [Gottschalkia purinilytica]|uniref:DUF2229 domain-containing protein n=1 Tax=Gottschalkia purinilytica TaxID=1503 RepID=A0A0L0WDJ0_GOTPU|nr:acyl-CoA dehydratase activase-related protein [Gottschalkia purinilytica]KNF09544.1 protein of unknown function DUF2229 [Gottschalkia purinilytica]
MKITFPHMGNTYVAAKALLEDLGNEVILPPKCSKKTLELGTKYSPENICLPLKINIGNYIESIEKGADTIVITGSCGPCRFGFYPLLEQEILRDLGYDVDLVTFDQPQEGIIELIRRVTKVTNTKSPYKILRSGIKAKKVLDEADNLIDFSNSVRARAIDKFKVDVIINKFYKDIENVYGVKEILRLIEDARKEMSKIKIDKDFKPMRVGIIGEIYTIIEPFVNLEIEKKLGYLGIEVNKSLSPSKWVDFHLASFPFRSKEEKRTWKAAKPYLETMVGGHGRETVGNAVMYAEEGYDGLIQILPLTCMPEIVAESIMPTIQNDYDIPILTLVVDEMTGESGYLTRIEAFVDLLKRRREEIGSEDLLFGS